LYEKAPEKDLMSGLARAASYVLALYVILKFGDLAVSGKLHYLADGSWESRLYIFEMLISAIVPAALFSIPKIRQSVGGLTIGAGLAVFGFVLNRIDVSGLATVTATRTNYFPMWMEFAISIGIVSGAALAFFFFVENFSVYEEEGEEERGDILSIKPGFVVRLHLPPMPNAIPFAVIFVVGATIGFAFMFNDVIYGLSPEKTPVEVVRRVEAVRTFSDRETLYDYDLYDPSKGEIPDNAELVQALLLDGDRKNKFVIFNHDEHKSLSGGEKSCGLCHHMEEPLSKTDFCHECHSDMFLPTEFENEDGQVMLAPGYMEAMHGRCVSCHADMDPPTARCNACHQGVDISLPGEREVFALVSR
jgi:hypothetical protein